MIGVGRDERVHAIEYAFDNTGCSCRIAHCSRARFVLCRAAEIVGDLVACARFRVVYGAGEVRILC
jgi:hypothetical protein